MNKNEPLGYLNINRTLYHTRISSKFKKRKLYKPADPKIILSFIPATVLDIYTEEGQYVKKGDILMILDAMKMKNKLICNIDGKVKSLMVKKGDKVPKGVILIEIE